MASRSLKVGFLLGLAVAHWTCLKASGATEESAKPDSSAVEFFEKKVRPILVNNCYSCHSADTNAKGGLRVDDRNGLINGGNSGPALVPGDVDGSLLISAIKHAEGIKMPPRKQLAKQEVADLSEWVKAGAHWPEAKASVAINQPNPRYERLKSEHWAWQPLREVTTPPVRDAAWPRTDIDRFVLAALDAKGLKPAGDADRRTLIRRLNFDLTGLPPEPAAIEAFVNNQSANSYEALVDKLLASPAFGEKWGRHWLDVARYGESTGASRNLPFPQAWRYRDYVIDAFNNDKPYDTFIREQVAGDLVTHKSEAERQEHLIATGFLALGVKDVNQRFKVRFVMDNVDEQIDTVTRSVLGLTVSCARCHDHKFDPIPTNDYYALAGIFTSTDLCAGLKNKMGGGGLDYYDPTLLLVPGKSDDKPDPVKAAKIADATKAVAAARAEFQAIRDKPEGDVKAPDGRPKRAVARQKMVKLQAALLALTDPAADGKAILGVRDARQVADTQVRFRGEAEKIGPTVPRGFLSVVNFKGAPQPNRAQSGRLELAQWLTDPRNPLASRVAVNRIWQHLIGQGIVGSVDNFGVTGERPTHPELLDHLAHRFVQQGWSVKKLVREIVLTRTYALSSESLPDQLKVDPANRLVWRHSPRRLDAEELRDAALLASGILDSRRPVASPAMAFKVTELRNNGPEARKLDEFGRASKHRSVYLPLLRGITPTALEVFDFAEQGMVTGRRDTTTVATQALYYLNDPFIRRQAQTLATAVLANEESNVEAILANIYLRVLGRKPSATETRRALAFVDEYESSSRPAFASLTSEDHAPPKVATVSATPARPVVQPANPDEVEQTDEPVKEESIVPASAKEAAWSALVQALLGSAEFRYLR